MDIKNLLKTLPADEIVDSLTNEDHTDHFLNSYGRETQGFYSTDVDNDNLEGDDNTDSEEDTIDPGVENSLSEIKDAISRYVDSHPDCDLKDFIKMVHDAVDEVEEHYEDDGEEEYDSDEEYGTEEK